jgi:hypothetical protein
MSTLRDFLTVASGWLDLIIVSDVQIKSTPE